MTCNKCGFNVAEGAKFCTACGNDLRNSHNTQETTNNTNESHIVNEEQKQNKNEVNSNVPINNNVSIGQEIAAEEKVNVWLAILSWFIPIAGLIIFFVKKKTEPKTAKVSGICALISFILGMVITGFAIMSVITAFNFTVDTTKEIIEDSYEVIEEIENQIEDELTNENEGNVTANISNDWKKYEVVISGKNYSLPIAYQDLSNATGFVIKDTHINMILPKNRYTTLNLYKGDKLALYTEIINNSDTEKKYIDCMVTKITQTKYQISQGADAIIFPGNIKAGDSITESEITALFGTPNDIKTYGDNINYIYLSDKTWTTTNNFKIKVINGIIDEIQLDHRG